MGANQLYKLMCCGKVTRTPRNKGGNWDVCYSCGAKDPMIHEVDKEDDVLFVGIDTNSPKTNPSVGDTLLMGTTGSTSIKKTKTTEGKEKKIKVSNEEIIGWRLWINTYEILQENILLPPAHTDSNFNIRS